MLAVAIATATLRALSYGTIYHAKLLRRGRDIDRAAPWRAFGDLTAADAMPAVPGPAGSADSHHNGDVGTNHLRTQSRRSGASFGRSAR